MRSYVENKAERPAKKSKKPAIKLTELVGEIVEQQLGCNTSEHSDFKHGQRVVVMHTNPTENLGVQEVVIQKSPLGFSIVTSFGGKPEMAQIFVIDSKNNMLLTSSPGQQATQKINHNGVEAQGLKNILIDASGLN